VRESATMSSEFVRGLKSFGYVTFGLFKNEFQIKEEITVNGLGLAFSSHSKEVNETIDRMRSSQEKRKAREGKEPEAPSSIVMSKANKKGVSKFDFDYHGQKYTLEGRPELKQFTAWITEYTKTAESCITCDRLLFPGEPAGAADKGLMHMTFDCCPSGGFYAGHIDEKGKLKPLTEQDLHSI